MSKVLVQFRLDDNNPVDACTLTALKAMGSHSQVAKQITQVYALAAKQNPAINVSLAQQQAIGSSPEPSCVQLEEQPVGEPMDEPGAEPVENRGVELTPIEINFDEL